MPKATIQHDVAALATALQVFLDEPGWAGRRAIDYLRDVDRGDQHPPGSHYGMVRQLWHSLAQSDYSAVARRPHDDRAFRAFLKASAGELHERHGLIVDLNRERLTIRRVDWRPLR
jgi:hypothetical protein